jgi:hypothetical protein
VVGAPPSLISLAGVDEMIALVENLRSRHPDVEDVMLVCDTLAAATPGAELAGSAHMTSALSRLQRVRDHFDAHLAIVTHTPKDSPTVARDSGALIGHADVTYNIHQKKITMAHINRGTLARPLPFTFEGVKMAIDDDGADYEVLFTDIREATGDVEGPVDPAVRPSAEAAFSGAKGKRQNDFETLKNEVVASIVRLGASGKKPTTTTMQDDMMGLQMLAVDQHGKLEEKERKRLERARNALRKEGVIYQDGDELGLKTPRPGEVFGGK